MSIRRCCGAPCSTTICRATTVDWEELACGQTQEVETAGALLSPALKGNQGTLQSAGNDPKRLNLTADYTKQHLKHGGRAVYDPDRWQYTHLASNLISLRLSNKGRVALQIRAKFTSVPLCVQLYCFCLWALQVDSKCDIYGLLLWRQAKYSEQQKKKKKKKPPASLHLPFMGCEYNLPEIQCQVQTLHVAYCSL